MRLVNEEWRMVGSSQDTVIWKRYGIAPYGIRLLNYETKRTINKNHVTLFSGNFTLPSDTTHHPPYRSVSIQKIIFPLQLIFRSVESKLFEFLLNWSDLSLYFCRRTIFFTCFFFSFCLHTFHFIWFDFYFKSSYFFSDLLCSQCRFNCKWFMSEYTEWYRVSFAHCFFCFRFFLPPQQRLRVVSHFFFHLLPIRKNQVK